MPDAFNIQSRKEWSTWAKSFPVRASGDIPYVSPFKVTLAAGKAPDILIYGPIGRDWMSEEGVAAKEFAQILSELPKNQKPRLRINSPGGNVFEGLSIFNLATEHGVDVRIDGVAASIAAVIACAGDTVEMPEASRMMIHKCFGLFIGNSDEVQEFKDTLDTCDEAQFGIIANKTGKTKQAIKAEMKKDRWFTASEAVAFGLADKVSEGREKSTKATSEQFFDLPISALASISAPQGGANNNKGPTMKREEIVALLKSWGVTVADTATDEWLKAELAKGKPAPAAPPPAPADAAPKTDPNAAKVEKLEKALEKQHRNSVALAIDKLILESRVTVAERDAEIALCMSDENRLTEVLAKRAQNLPGADPLRGGIARYGDEGPMDAIIKLPKASERVALMKRDWSVMNLALASRKGLPMAANTVDADLVTQMLTDGATTVLQNRLAPLRTVSVQFEADRLKPLAVLQHRKVTAGGTVQTNATNFEDTTNFVGTNTNVAITMAQKTSGKHVTNAERQSGHAMEFWATIHAAEIADAIMAVVTATILEGTFTATPLVSAAANFGGDELSTLWGQLKKSTIHNIMLDGEYFAKFLPTDRFDFGITEFRNRGWDNFVLNTVWTGATANTVGFACHPQAIAVGLGLPIRDPQANAVSTETVFNLPELGVSVALTQWFANAGRVSWATYDVMVGATANDTTAGVLVKSA